MEIDKELKGIIEKYTYMYINIYALDKIKKVDKKINERLNLIQQ